MQELAVMVVRSVEGTMKLYPVVETVHRDSICHVTEAPADVPEAVRQRAAAIAEKAIGCLEGAGIFGWVLVGERRVNTDPVVPPG